MNSKNADFKIKRTNRKLVPTKLLAKPDLLAEAVKTTEAIGDRKSINKHTRGIQTPLIPHRRATPKKSHSEDECHPSKEKMHQFQAKESTNGPSVEVGESVVHSPSRVVKHFSRNDSADNTGNNENKESEFEIDGVCKLEDDKEVSDAVKKPIKKKKMLVVTSRYMQASKGPLRAFNLSFSQQKNNNNSSNNKNSSNSNRNNSNTNDNSNNSSNKNNMVDKNKGTKDNHNVKDSRRVGAVVKTRVARRSSSLKENVARKKEVISKSVEEAATTSKTQHTTTSQHTAISQETSTMQQETTAPAAPPHAASHPTQTLFTPILLSKPHLQAHQNTTQLSNPPVNKGLTSSTPNLTSANQNLRLFSSIHAEDISAIGTTPNFESSRYNTTIESNTKANTSILKKAQSGSDRGVQDTGLMYSRYVQYVYADARLEDCISKQQKQAVEQIYNLWRLNDSLATDVADLQLELKSRKMKQRQDFALDQLYEWLVPLDDKITHTSKVYEQLLNKSQLSDETLVVKNMYLNNAADDDEEANQKFHHDLLDVLQETDHILSTMQPIIPRNNLDVNNVAEKLQEINDETTQVLDSFRRAQELSSKLHSLHVEENFLNLQSNN